MFKPGGLGHFQIKPDTLFVYVHICPYHPHHFLNMIHKLINEKKNTRNNNKPQEKRLKNQKSNQICDLIFHI